MKELFQKEYNKLLQYTRRQLGGIKFIDPEDILHEVAFNVFRKMDFETVIDNLAAYLYRSIKNGVIDVIRKPKKTINLSSFESENGQNKLLESTINDDEPVDTQIERKELNEQIHLLLQSLPAEYREIIIATEFEGYTLKELSEKWNIPLGTLLSRRHRALAKLQNLLENFNIL